jgi:hypothetical protein
MSAALAAVGTATTGRTNNGDRLSDTFYPPQVDLFPVGWFQRFGPECKWFEAAAGNHHCACGLHAAGAEPVRGP